jgi:hypothetical protein
MLGHLPDALPEVIAKLREVEEQLRIALVEAQRHPLLASRIRHVNILAKYVRLQLEALEVAAVMAEPSQRPKDKPN